MFLLQEKPWTRFHYIIIILMLTFGTINTIAYKWANEASSKGVSGEVKPFHHPFFQSMTMFAGEFLCLLAFKILYFAFKRKGEGLENENKLTKGNRDFNPIVLAMPAICDMSASCMMFVGLNLTYASSYQMFRGGSVVFVGIMSMFVLKKFLGFNEWCGIGLVIVGLVLVALSDYFSEKTGTRKHSKMDVIIGDIIIIMAQFFAAVQMSYEEKFVKNLDIPPMQAIGWEGVFGLSVLIILQVPFYLIRANPPITEKAGDRIEDVIDAFVQISNNGQLVIAITGVVISMAIYNFSGITLSKELSATTRKVLDSLRTISIWMLSIILFGQKFHWLQLVGFFLLVTGTMLYNHVTLDSIKRIFGKATTDNEEIQQ